MDIGQLPTIILNDRYMHVYAHSRYPLILPQGNHLVKIQSLNLLFPPVARGTTTSSSQTYRFFSNLAKSSWIRRQSSCLQLAMHERNQDNAIYLPYILICYSLHIVRETMGALSIINFSACFLQRGKLD